MGSLGLSLKAKTFGLGLYSYGHGLQISVLGIDTLALITLNKDIFILCFVVMLR